MFFRYSLLLLLYFTISTSGNTQTIRLNNPSFEDFPRPSIQPVDWHNCGFSGETPPDVQPSGEFGVTKLAFDGYTYLGMVVRDNETWERVAQQLTSPLENGNCYSFSLYLSRSGIYSSRSRLTNKNTEYTQAVKLRIWGGDYYCKKQELLAESNLVKNTEWQKYNFKLKPTATYNFIMLEAYYQTPVLVPYNGNILVDNASDIEKISCDKPLDVLSKPVITFINPSKSIKTKEKSYTVKAKINNIDKKEAIDFYVNGQKTAFSFDKEKEQLTAKVLLKKNKNRIEISVENAAGSDNKKTEIQLESLPVVVSNTEPEKTIGGFTKNKLSQGQTINIEKLYFETDDTTITEESYVVLDELYSFLAAYQEVMIEIGGHTNSNCDDSHCDPLSTQRAKNVADYLHKKGIERSRLQYKGYGKRKPIVSNKTVEGRQQNQRVEIKILSIG